MYKMQKQMKILNAKQVTLKWRSAVKGVCLEQLCLNLSKIFIVYIFF